MSSIEYCLIWEDLAQGHHGVDTDNAVVQWSPRAGGGYEITREAQLLVGSLDKSQKARLTTMLVDHHHRSKGKLPIVTQAWIKEAEMAPTLAVHERAERLLRYITEQEPPGTPFEILGDAGIYAWSESTEDNEIGFLINYLRNAGWLTSIANVAMVTFGDYQVPKVVIVTVDGHKQIAERRIRVKSSQAFVAMWFHDSMDGVLKEGIKPGIEAAGYKPLVISEKEHIEKIDDEIMAEVRRSRFLVADFTQGSDGARGGVYYEAGFARGLGLPVIYTCRKDMVDENLLHFDTRQYNHILWSTAKELRESLENRIVATIGEGPEVSGAC